jgi:predicted DNA-binding transcriptional regulator YafY
LIRLNLSPVYAEWREEGLGTIDVEINFYSKLSYSYEKTYKEEDIKRERAGDTLNVVRRVSNTFWLIRTLLPYGEDCKIIAPDSVRSLIAHKLQTATARYE